MSFIDIIGNTGGIIGQDIDLTIRTVLHDNAYLIGQPLVGLVRQVTPVMSGALSDDMMFEVTTEVDDNELLRVFALGAEQIDFWGRIYVQYVEGEPLGTPTWTNPPRHIFLDTAENEGRDITEIWAVTFVDIALTLCAAGQGIAL